MCLISKPLTFWSRILGAVAVSAAGISCGTPAERASAAYLDAAVQVGRWLQSTANQDAGFIPDEIVTPFTFSADLGTGAAGRSLFFLELHHVTGDPQFLRSAVREAEAAAASLLHDDDTEPMAFGLYNGMAGVAFAMTEVYKATGESRFLGASRRLIDSLLERAREGARGAAYWSDANDILTGSAGIGLVLLYVADALEDTTSLTFVQEIGYRLLRHGNEAGDGMWWSRTADGDFNLPNFSHGTAGVGYFLARLYGATGNAAFLDGAERAAAYLVAVADLSNGLFLIPYGIPNDGYVTPYDIGWAHGPAGSARLFFELWKQTGMAEYSDIVERLAGTLAATGLPDGTADSSKWVDPFRVDRRFGTSGAAQFLLRLYRVEPHDAYRDLATRIVDDLLDRGVRDEEGLRWRLPRYGFQGDRGTDATFTGFFYGAAGLGLTLLEMHYTEAELTPLITFPDDPFDGIASPVGRACLNQAGQRVAERFGSAGRHS